ncbi:hypothetical protein [Streptomyces sp. NPDC048644]|uniref:hypothetical protein n=1 Tax=Streptomyces sp. NPDC048644 TaxID=3365582 RepID=UPI003712658B
MHDEVAHRVIRISDTRIDAHRRAPRILDTKRDQLPYRSRAPNRRTPHTNGRGEQVLCPVHQAPREQPRGRRLAEPDHVVEHHLRVLQRAAPPVADLLAGQVLKDELLLLADVVDSRLGRGGRGVRPAARARRPVPRAAGTSSSG